jgi:hypothetical protein
MGEEGGQITGVSILKASATNQASSCEAARSVLPQRADAQVPGRWLGVPRLQRR